ncbi:hypothetical protein MKZ38_003049 [Zalerion maritima]|uniref:Uncharacterized protein n=1 Tax=Zalerion maritima TaxID=339359 RepID=A0AAD5RPH1_9PEZI|nr:hypothetical protein MKZ38_003049 [Zalerion maritima]
MFRTALRISTRTFLRSPFLRTGLLTRTSGSLLRISRASRAPSTCALLLSLYNVLLHSILPHGPAAQVRSLHFWHAYPAALQVVGGVLQQQRRVATLASARLDGHGRGSGTGNGRGGFHTQAWLVGTEQRVEKPRPSLRGGYEWKEANGMAMTWQTRGPVRAFWSTASPKQYCGAGSRSGGSGPRNMGARSDGDCCRQTGSGPSPSYYQYNLPPGSCHHHHQRSNCQHCSPPRYVAISSRSRSMTVPPTDPPFRGQCQVRSRFQGRGRGCGGSEFDNPAFANRGICHVRGQRCGKGVGFASDMTPRAPRSPCLRTSGAIHRPWWAEAADSFTPAGSPQQPCRHHGYHYGRCQPWHAEPESQSQQQRPASQPEEPTPVPRSLPSFLLARRESLISSHLSTISRIPTSTHVPLTYAVDKLMKTINTERHRRHEVQLQRGLQDAVQEDKFRSQKSSVVEDTEKRIEEEEEEEEKLGVEELGEIPPATEAQLAQWLSTEIPQTLEIYHSEVRDGNGIESKAKEKKETEVKMVLTCSKERADVMDWRLFAFWRDPGVEFKFELPNSEVKQ